MQNACFVLFCGSIRIIEFALSAFPLTSCEYTQLRQDPLHSGSTAQILRDMTTAVPLLRLSGIGPIYNFVKPGAVSGYSSDFCNRREIFIMHL